MNSQQESCESKSYPNTNTTGEPSPTERMLGLRPRHAARTFEDFSIFNCSNGDAFEPLPIDRPRTEQQTAAVRRVFQDSIRLLQHPTATTRPGFPTQATLSSSPLEDQRTPEVGGSLRIPQGAYSSLDAIDSAAPTNEAVRPTHRAEDQRISQSTHSQDEYSLVRFRPYQTQLWEQRFEDLLHFRRQHGHCCVPHTYTPNPSLARWVKRQRYQFKLRTQGKESTMTNRRVQALEEAGFIWDRNHATWEERLNELKLFRMVHGHCEVPTHYQQNRRLATWVKCQRRQYKLYNDGKQSTITPARIEELDEVGFSWEMRAGAKDPED